MSTTPGPWAVSYSLNSIESQKSGTVCRFKPHDDPCSLDDMNLIAAAPDILAALRELLETSVPCPGSTSMELNGRGQIARTRAALILRKLGTLGEAA